MTTMQDTHGNAALTRIEPAPAAPYEGLRMVVAPAEAKRRLQELQAFVKESMEEDVDYGIIPGTEKRSLYQPGAQKLAELYGLTHRFEIVEAVKDWERGFFYFEYRCVLVSRRDGGLVGEGIGSCNSRESKYAGRWVPRGDVPPGMDRATLQVRRGARWAFKSELPPGTDPSTLPTQKRKSKKPGGAEYTVYKVMDEQYLVPNPDPYSLVNTLQKMAAKRAYIHAVIAATRSSGILTQDAEDLPADVYGEAEATRSWEEPEERPETAASKLEEKLRSQPTAAPAKQPAHPPAKPAKPLAPEAERAARVQQYKDGLAAADTLVQLKGIWDVARADVDEGKLSGDELKALNKQKEEAKARIVARQKGEVPGQPAAAPAAAAAATQPAATGTGAPIPDAEFEERPQEREPGID
jgi:hypothetical protein